MKRVEKPEGRFNISVTDVECPEYDETEVLIEAEYSLISRGSELWRRYSREEPIEHDMMGYSLGGTVKRVGDEVDGFTAGDTVAAVAPHAEYVSVEVVDPSPVPAVVPLPEDLSTEIGTFWPLLTSSVLWVREAAPEADDTVVIQGQGLVGSGCLQVLRSDTDARVIALDAFELRCDLARELGADDVIDVSETDPVEAVTDSIGGKADVVVEAVGGPAGSDAFEQAQRLVTRGGLIQVLGLYEDEPLPLDSSRIQGRRLVGGYTDPSGRPAASERALALLAAEESDFEAMVTHRFPAGDAADAFDFLYQHPEETLGVLLDWTDS